MPASYTIDILVQCQEKQIKVAYLSLLKGGHISFGSSDKSEWSKRGKITYHPNHRVHVKGPGGEYISEAFTFFNNPNVDKDWLWCEAISNPLAVIESGSLRTNRTSDRQLYLKTMDNMLSVRIGLYKLSQPPAAPSIVNENYLCEYIEWYGTFLGIELSLVPGQIASLQASVMN
jgi:hypothetical protein